MSQPFVAPTPKWQGQPSAALLSRRLAARQRSADAAAAEFERNHARLAEVALGRVEELRDRRHRELIHRAQLREAAPAAIIREAAREAARTAGSEQRSRSHIEERSRSRSRPPPPSRSRAGRSPTPPA